MLRIITVLLCINGLWSCHPVKQEDTTTDLSRPYLMVLGIAQDAGYPQVGCQKNCCEGYWKGEKDKRLVSCVALIDPVSQQKWVFDATPDFKEQLYALNESLPSENMLPNGIFLTHAHIGHYTGLMQLGREVMGANALPVYAMPKMRDFLTQNGPWSQLVSLKNIAFHKLQADTVVQLNERIRVTPFIVPHRDEFSETVGYEIVCEGKRAIFIPDIDKWEKWDRSIQAKIQQVDYALLDGSFYKNGELPNRDMSEIPHPFVEESMNLFKNMDASEKEKIIFIHFNHTNPLLHNSLEKNTVFSNGFRVAEEGMILEL